VLLFSAWDVKLTIARRPVPHFMIDCIICMIEVIPVFLGEVMGKEVESCSACRLKIVGRVSSDNKEGVLGTSSAHASFYSRWVYLAILRVLLVNSSW
jgi:hypothetical protein